MQEYYPPFIPRVQSWEDTKYFDDEGPISDMDSTSSDEDSPTPIFRTVPAEPNSHHQEAQGIVPAIPIDESTRKASPCVMSQVKASKVREKKRPRDKILRDENCGKMALQMRKESAFIGYGYRRSKTVTEVIEETLNFEANSHVIGEDDGELLQIEVNREC